MTVELNRRMVLMGVLTKDRIGALLLLAFCVWYYSLIDDIRLLPFQLNSAFTARSMPTALAFLGAGLALLLLISPSGDSDDRHLDLKTLGAFEWVKGALFLLLMLAYAATIRRLGFIPSTTLFLILGYMILGERRPLPLVLASAPLVVAFWVLMSEGLEVFVAPWPSPQFLASIGLS